jgi:hypothetical protein
MAAGEFLCRNTDSLLGNCFATLGRPLQDRRKLLGLLGGGEAVWQSDVIRRKKMISEEGSERKAMGMGMGGDVEKIEGDQGPKQSL